jgi:hypothetical protein
LQKYDELKKQDVQVIQVGEDEAGKKPEVAAKQAAEAPQQPAEAAAEPVEDAKKPAEASAEKPKTLGTPEKGTPLNTLFITPKSGGMFAICYKFVLTFC